MSEKSARERFVEAMRVLKTLPGYQAAKHVACDAFADAECGSDSEDCGGQDSKFSATVHAECRAALHKEIFGE